MREIYLDYNASAPLDERVFEAMAPAMAGGVVGNASSVHVFGQRRAAEVDEAREHVAALVGGRASGVVFTSGATEANNLALRGAADAISRAGSCRGSARPRMLVSAVEHASVARTARWLADSGMVELDVIGVGGGGFVEPEAVDELLGPDVSLVSVMAANGETGVVNPVAEIAGRVRAAGALMHCDATQAAGRAVFDMQSMGVDLVSLSGHKICGPGGMGALVGTRAALRRLAPLLHGGGHEQGLRSGSLNVAGIVGLGAAARITANEREQESARLETLRDAMVERIVSALPGVHDNGDTARRLTNTASMRFEGADAEAVVVNMDPVAVSAGSACSAGSIEPSAVLLAMGLSRKAAFESVRFSLGRFTTTNDIDTAADAAITAVQYVRSLTT